jgi:hypothetical protein
MLKICRKERKSSIIIKLVILVILCLLINVFLCDSIYASNVEGKLREKVTIENPIDVFTIYSYMNYTGYDRDNNQEDNGKMVYHPVREGVRADLVGMNLNLSNSTYFADIDAVHTMVEGDFACITGYVGSPPNFQFEPSIVSIFDYYMWDFSGLDELLTEFYREADIDALYNKYKPYYDEEISKYQDKVFPVLTKIAEHFNLNLDDIHGFRIAINLLESNWKGYMIDPNGRWAENSSVILMVGPEPSGEPNLINIAHEFSHVFISPIIDNSKEAEELIYALFRAYGEPKADGYGSWNQVIDESFVRAISGWATGQSDFYYYNETQEGFILTEYIYNSITDFNKSELDFEDYIKKLMVDYTNKLNEEHNLKDSGIIGSIRVEDISLEQSSLELNINQSYQLDHRIIPDNASVKSITWKSTDPTIATVDDKGNVTALDKGHATIIVSTIDSGKLAFCNIEVLGVQSSSTILSYLLNNISWILIVILLLILLLQYKKMRKYDQIMEENGVVLKSIRIKETFNNIMKSFKKNLRPITISCLGIIVTIILISLFSSTSKDININDIKNEQQNNDIKNEQQNNDMSNEQQNLESKIVAAPILVEGVIENTGLTGTYNVMLLITNETLMTGNQTGAENILINEGITRYQFSSGMNMLVGGNYEYIMYIDTNKNYELDPGELKSVVTSAPPFDGKAPITIDFTEWEE